MGSLKKFFTQLYHIFFLTPIDKKTLHRKNISKHVKNISKLDNGNIYQRKLKIN